MKILEVESYRHRTPGPSEEKEVRNPRLGLSARSVPRGQGWEMRALLASTTLNKGSYRGLRRTFTNERLRDSRLIAPATSRKQFGVLRGARVKEEALPFPAGFLPRNAISQLRDQSEGQGLQPTSPL